MKRKRLYVSDHAVLRYLERHGGFEIEKLRQQIAARLAPLAATGAAGIKIDGVVFIIRDGVDARYVTTVLERDRAVLSQQEGGNG